MFQKYLYISTFETRITYNLPNLPSLDTLFDFV